jgi:hypothetical protein
VTGGPYVYAAIGEIAGGHGNKLPPPYLPEINLTVLLITTALVVALLVVGADL